MSSPRWLSRFTSDSPVPLLDTLERRWRRHDGDVFAQRVILGKTKYNEVPSTLQPGVRDILVESGLEFLIEE